MNKKDVLNYFGSAAKTARALRISESAVYQWGEILSDRIAYKIELVTGGKLKTVETMQAENHDK